MLDVTDLRHSYSERVALAGVEFPGRRGRDRRTSRAKRSGEDDDDALGDGHPDARTRGTVSWDGRPIGEARAGCASATCPRSAASTRRCACSRQVIYFARLHGLAFAPAQGSARAWLEQLGLGERVDERLIALSHGNQQRVQLAVALVHEPELLVLDEPFAGLDPEAVESLSDVLRARADAGVAVLFSSHQLELVERVCRRVVILDAGRVLVAGTLRELREHMPAQLLVKVDAPSGWAGRARGRTRRAR